MNILIVGDDGPKAYGLVLLREFAKRHFREAPQVTMTLNKSVMGRSFGIRPKAPRPEELKMIANDQYVLDSPFPSDLIYLAMMYSDRFLRGGAAFDLVLSGVNLGPNVGLDVLHSGTVASAILSSMAFQACAFAFSQDLPRETKEGDTGTWPEPGSADESKFYRATELYLPEILREYEPVAGECYNFNFPALKSVDDRALGYATTKVANYSNWKDRRDTTLPVTPQLDDDVQKLTQGYVTVSPLEMRLNPVLR